MPAARASAADAPVGAALLFLLTAFLGLQPLSTDLYLPSLPAIAGAFGVGAAAVQQTLTLFIAGFAAAQLVAGPLADRFGRRPVAIAGVATYVAASGLGALADSLAVLLAARLAQAVGVCCTVVCARSIVRDLYAPDEGARVMSRVFSWMTGVIVAGPIAGGLLQARFGWPAAFVAMAAASAAVLALALARLPETNRHRDPRALAPGPLARNYRAVLASRPFRAYALLSMCSYAGVFSWLAGSSFVMIRTLGLTPGQYGLCFGGIGLGYWAGTLIARPLIRRLGLQGATRPAAAWALAMGVAMLLPALAGVRHPAAVLVPATLFVVSHGILQPCSQAGAIAPFPRNAGAAAALLGAITLMGMLAHLAVSAAATLLAPGGHDGAVQLAVAFFVATLGVALVAFGPVRRDGRLTDE